MSLTEYRRKRRFDRTPEPAARKERRRKKGLAFVVQKHAASRLHYDFRLEHDGALLSWAIPKGPSLDPAERRLAVQVEDHPLAYVDFEGAIPKGEYGGGSVVVWDRGTWEPEGDVAAMLKRGKLKFRLNGEKLSGVWNLVRGRNRNADEKNWLLIKSRDEAARARVAGDILGERPESVISGRTVEQVAVAPERTWRHGKSEPTPRSQPGVRTRRKQFRAGAVEGAVKGRMPATMEPQLALASAAVPEGDDWLHEIKYDGYRVLARIDKRVVQLITRGGHDWSGRFPEIAATAAEVPIDQAWLDGEIVALDAKGLSSFSALQDSLSRKETADLVYFVFDLLFLDGFDLRPASLDDRKALLQKLLHAAPTRLRYVDHQEGHGDAFRDAACEAGLEGSIAKKRFDPYRSGRSGSWLKLKCGRSGEFVVGGYTPPKGSRAGFGSLLLGEYDSDGNLVYAGRVGTGFDAAALDDAMQRMKRLARKQCPFSSRPAGAGREVVWVDPVLVAEVRYAERTADGLLRQASFRGWREDKPAVEVTVEEPLMKRSAKKTSRVTAGSNRKRAPRTNGTQPLPESSLAQLAGIRLTSPGKVLDPKSGATKFDLAQYYATVAEWMLPHVAGRPLSLVRCPEGVGADCFFQKHADRGTLPMLERLPLKGEEKESLVVRDLAGLAALAQMGVLEIHVWGSRADRPDRPDRMILDLDPGEGVRWTEVLDAARLVRERLDQLGLISFVKTTGGKGLHVVAPLDRRHDWDAVKSFARALAERLSGEFPKRFLAKATKAARSGRIYVDYLRNGRGATAVAPYSPRAREGAPVAVPLFWEELEAGLKPAAFTLASVPQRLAALENDPWTEMLDIRQSITAAALKQLRGTHR